MRFYIILFSLFAFSAQAQMVVPTRPFTKPGIRYSGPSEGVVYQQTFRPGYNLRSSSEIDGIGDNKTRVSTNRQLLTRLRFPLWYSQGLVALGGVKYAAEDFNFTAPDNSSYPLYDEVTEGGMLKTISFSLTAIKPFRNKSYIMLNGSMRHSGLMKKLILKEPYRAFSGGGAYIRKPNEDTQMGLGFAYAYRPYHPRKHSIYPVVVYHHNFSPKHGIEATLPKEIMFRYSPGPKNFLFAGVKGRTERYILPQWQVEDYGILRMNRTEAEYGVTWQHKIFSVLWSSVGAGLRQSFTFNIRESWFNERIITSRAAPSPYFQVKLFLSPP